MQDIEQNIGYPCFMKPKNGKITIDDIDKSGINTENIVSKANFKEITINK